MNFIYNLSKEGLGNISEEDIQTLAESAKKSNAVYNTLTSITDSNPFGITIKNEETRTNLVQAIESAFAKSEKTEKDITVFNAIAKILGLDKDINLA